MKATVHFWCQPAALDATYQAEDIVITVFLPFIPHVGMHLKVTAGGDFHQVESVYWDTTEPDEVQVFLQEPDDGDMEPWEQMRAEGWRAA